MGVPAAHLDYSRVYIVPPMLSHTGFKSGSSAASAGRENAPLILPLEFPLRSGIKSA